jgi:hypothetical protein
MTDTAIGLLISSAPDWSVVTLVHISKFKVRAAPHRASGVRTRSFDLLVSEEDAEVVVREEAQARKLPAFCPERHINKDSSFCLGLDAGSEVTTLVAATYWWDKLKSFLVCQETAEETGFWPPYAQLSHGEAGEIEAKAEVVSRSINCLSEYREAVQHNSGFIAERLTKINKATGRLYNGRAPCLCGRKGQRGQVVLRRICHKLGCPVEFEFKRRLAVDRFWKSMAHKTCCGSMQNCPLERGEND